MAFSLTEAARAALETRIVQSALPDPVICFIRVAADLCSDKELKRLLASPDASESTVREKFLQLNPDPSNLNWRWAPAVYERDLFPSEFLYETDGIRFVLPEPMRERLSKAWLDVDQSGFIFRGDGQVTEPF
jgi:hypothetical protein